MFYVILISGVILDLLTKNIASVYLNNQINLIGDFIYLRFIENTGIAFSIQIPSFILKILTISLIIGIFYYYIKEIRDRKSSLLDISFALILAGAIGNGIERVFYSKVIDFIGIKYFAVFNLADSFITTGAILYIYYYFKLTHRLTGTSLKPKGR